MQDKIINIIKDHPRKRIEVKEIVAVLKDMGQNLNASSQLHEQFISSMEQLIEQGDLKPLKSAKKLLKYRGLASKYEINVQTRSDDILPASELYPYHQRIDMSYYSKHREEYYVHERYIRRIDALFKQENPPVLRANERSFLLFDDEKALTEPDKAGIDGLLILKKLGGITLEDLFSKKTYEPFFYYKKDEFDRKEKRAVLIIENKDTFWTVLEAIKSGYLPDINLLIFGEGNGISKKFEFIEHINGRFSDSYYYFGDIDLEGIEIYNRLYKKFAEYDIAPAVAFYEHLLKVVGPEGARALKTKRRLKDRDLSPFIDHFNPETAEAIRSIIEQHRCLPQEGLNNNHISQWGHIEYR